MRRWIALLLAAALATGLLCACSTGEAEGEAEFLLWFVAEPDPANRSAMPGGLGTQAYEGRENVPAVMAALLEGPAAEGSLRSPFPAGTRLLNWSQSSGIVRVDLSQAYGGLVGVDLTIADYCITLTLTQIEGVEGVCITVNGAELPYRSRQIFRREDVVFSGAEEEPVELSAALCFRRAGTDELAVELRIFRLTESESPTLAVLEALLAGPDDEGLEPLLPEGVEVYSARVDDGVCYADFSTALLDGMPEDPAERDLVLCSVSETLCSLGSVETVEILVEGEPLPWEQKASSMQPALSGNSQGAADSQ